MKEKYDYTTQINFGDPNAYLNYVRKQYERTSPIVRMNLFLKLGNFEIIVKKGD